MVTVSDSELTPGLMPGCVMAIGNFDGVHLGHQALVGKLKERAAALGGKAVIYTFDPHPLKILNPSACPPALTDFDQKAALLEKLGVDVLVRVRFDHDYAAQDPSYFAEEILGNVLGAKEVWLGPDFAFGKNRTGTLDTLRKVGARLGYEVCMLTPVLVDGVRISSTRVRAAVEAKDFDLAKRLLGRPYALHGPIVRGEARGRQLGFPTANLLNREECIPPSGVYAARARIEDGGWLAAAVNIGRNPTFAAQRTTIEAHLPGFDGDIYGKNMQLQFVKSIRGEIAFASVSTLIEQIGRDVAEVVKIMEEKGVEPG